MTDSRNMAVHMTRILFCNIQTDNLIFILVRHNKPWL